MTVVQPTQTPASEALGLLLAIESALPEALQSSLMFDRQNVTVVLVESVDAWKAWTFRLISLRCEVESHLGDSLLWAQAVVASREVLILRGDLPEAVLAA